MVIGERIVCDEPFNEEAWPASIFFSFVSSLFRERERERVTNLERQFNLTKLYEPHGWLVWSSTGLSCRMPGIDPRTTNLPSLLSFKNLEKSRFNILFKCYYIHWRKLTKWGDKRWMTTIISISFIGYHKF